MATQYSFIRQAILSLSLLLPVTISFSQTAAHNKKENELAVMYAKLYALSTGDYDSLISCSKHFTATFNNYISQNPVTIAYPFQQLRDSNIMEIVTATDGLFRIYSWDNWQGGSMHSFNNIIQYKSGSKVYTVNLPRDETDNGTMYSGIYILNANNITYYLVTNTGSISTKDAYESIRIFSIDNNKLNDKVALIKTKSGLNNSISFDYDFFSVADRPERPLRLIQYDAVKKIISIPIVIDNGKVTNRFIRYQFNGQFFEHLETQKKK